MTTYNREQILTVIRDFRAVDAQCLQLSPGKEYREACERRRKLRTRAREMIESAPEKDQAELEAALSQLHRYKTTELVDTPTPVKLKKKHLLCSLILKNRQLSRTIVEKVKTASGPVSRNELFKAKLEQQLSLRLARAGVIQVDTLDKNAEDRMYWYDNKATNKPALSELFED